MYRIIDYNNCIFNFKSPFIIQNTITKCTSHGLKTKEDAESVIKALYKYHCKGI